MTTLRNNMYRIYIESPLTTASYYFRGGCLTRLANGPDSAVVYVTRCELLNNDDNSLNQKAWLQQWEIKPSTVAGLSGVRIIGRTFNGTAPCLQMGDGNDKLYARECTEDKRQVFAIAFTKFPW